MDLLVGSLGGVVLGDTNSGASPAFTAARNLARDVLAAIDSLTAAEPILSDDAAATADASVTTVGMNAPAADAAWESAASSPPYDSRALPRVRSRCVSVSNCPGCCPGLERVARTAEELAAAAGVPGGLRLVGLVTARCSVFLPFP